MRKANWNFLIDALSFVAFVLLVSTGVIMHYLLPPGTGRHLVLWGFDRHEWGAFHFWVAVALLVLLAVHLVLHWRWVVCMVRGREGGGSRLRFALAVIGLLALLGLAVAPLVSPARAPAEPATGPAAYNGPSLSIRGSMTLREVADAAGVPIAVLVRDLRLPADTPEDARLGRLRREFGFAMQDVRQCIARHETDGMDEHF